MWVTTGTLRVTWLEYFFYYGLLTVIDKSKLRWGVGDIFRKGDQTFIADVRSYDGF